MRLTLQNATGVLLFAIGAANWTAIALVNPLPGSQETVDAAQIDIDRATGARVFRGRVFTGNAVTRHPNGVIARFEAYVEGRRDGELTMWFESGQIGYMSRYENGRRSGLATSWWRNGNKRSETRYVDDRADGVSSHWYPTGERYKRFQFEDGVPVGLQKAWRLNGKLYSNFEYRNGRAYGLRNANLCVELDDEALPLPTT